MHLGDMPALWRRQSSDLMKGKSTRVGVYKCRECEKPFSVTVETVFVDSKVPLHKWVSGEQKSRSSVANRPRR
jgi:hypothetical protein